jgi:multidrug efflux system membrane fusion protein
MRKLLLFAALLVMGGGVWLLFQGRALVPGPAVATNKNDAVPVRIADVEVRDAATTLNTIGTVQAYSSVLVRARVDGQLDKVAFTEGQDVHRGDLLAQLDPRPFEAQLRAAQAQKDKDAAQLANIERDLERFSNLAVRGLVPAQTLDTTRAQVGQLKATVGVDQAQVDTARLQLDYATIRAPLDGRTGARLVDAGNMVHAADTNGLVLITQVHPINVSFTLPQDILPALLAQQRKAALHVAALSRDASQRLGDGTLTLIDNQIDQATGTIHCKALFDNTADLLWPGEFVALRVVLDVHRDALTIPATAVQSGADGPYVFVVKGNGTADLRRVEVAATEMDRSVIAHGLAAGERVVIEGQYKLESGTPVRAVEHAKDVK